MTIGLNRVRRVRGQGEDTDRQGESDKGPIQKYTKMYFQVLNKLNEFKHV